MLNETNNLGEKIAALQPLFGASLPELIRLMERFDQPVYRARQIYEAVYNQRLSSLDEITTLPTVLREALKATGHTVGLPQIVQTARSIDGTERYLVRMADGETVETVWMPGGDGGERGDGTQAAEEEEHPSHDDDDYKRATICISSQVGCAVNCQNVEVGRDRINLVFMGMGEPFLNYAAFMDAVRLLTGPMHIPESRMTVSTSGILPGIEQFAQETIRPKLAVSLNASNDVVRESIMPITRKWNIAALLEAISTVPLRPRERVTFEYVLLGGITDRREHADELIALLKNLRAKINLIVWNPGPDMPFHEPTPQDVAIFQKRLRDAGIPAFIRKPRGRDIYAACGQLKRTLEQPLAQMHPHALVDISPAI